MVTALNPPKSDAPFALLDVAGGTGDIAFRAAKAAGAGFRATVCDINADMLEVGRNRAAAQHLDQQVSFVEGNAEALAFPDRSLRRLYDRLRDPQRAADRRRAERGLSRAAARQPVPVPGILYRRRARPRPAVRFVLVQGDPAARPRRDRRRRVLSISRRIDPQVPEAKRVCRDDPAAGFARAKWQSLSGGIVALHSGWRL